MACLFSITFQQGAPSNFVFVLFLFFVLFCFVLFCFVLFCFVLFCSVLFCSVLFCFVLFCFVLFCFCPERRGWGGRHSTIAWTLQSLKAKKCLV